MTIVYFLLLLTVIICLHELGHLIAAKAFGVYCYEYSFGMGPVLLRKKTKETEYCLRALPVGGFVAMAGETDGDELYPDVVVPEGRRLTQKPAWQKIIIMLAGVFVNFLLCFVLLSLTVLHSGGYVVYPKATIDTVVEGSPAQEAGFMDGDTIVYMSTSSGLEMKINDLSEVSAVLSASEGQPVEVAVDRSGEEVLLSVTPLLEEDGVYRIGIQGVAPEVVYTNILTCWRGGIYEMRSMTRSMLDTIASLFKGKNWNQMSGPVGIYTVTESAVAAGPWSYLFLVGILSLNVGIFNLLPLPVLDGGQVIMTIIEAIVGKPLDKKVKMAIMLICWALLICMMVFVTYNDIARVFN